MQRIKLLFVIPSLDTGGAERVALHLLKYINRKKFEVALCLFEKKGKLISEVPPDIRIFDLKKRNRWNFPFLALRLHRVIKICRPDIILTWLWYSTAVTAITKVIFKNKRLPLFIAYEPHNHKQDIQYEGFQKLKSFLIDSSHKAADLVIAVSYGAANDICQNYRLNKKSIKVIHNPIDISIIQRLIPEKVTSPFSEYCSLIIIGFGRLIKRKGFDCLIKAFSVVREKIPCKLLLIGDGEERANLEHLVEILGIKKDVFFAGYQDNPYKFIAKAEIFVLSSLWEGFGNVIVEAMACGTPVISTRCPHGPDEIITDEINGKLVPVGDIDALAQAMACLLKDEHLRRRLEGAGCKRAEDFRAEKKVAEYEKVFLEIIESRGTQ
jgi:glycosyltransferase involved in cell wall biosynthesis